MSSERLKQVVVPRRRAAARTRRIKAPGIDLAWLRAHARLFLRIGGALLLLIMMIVAYQKIAAWPAFQLRNVEVSGNYRVSSAEVERAVRQQLSSTLLSASVGKLQEQLQTFTWIKRAQVTRILPDTLRVQIEERKPLALVRFDKQQPVWIDEEAVVLGEYDSALDKDVPPLVYGFAQDAGDAAHNENRERIDLYKRLIWALDSGPVKYSTQVEEIDLSNLKDVRLQLSRGPVEVDLGDRDFRARLMRALDILDALRRHDIAALKDYKFSDAQILAEPERIRFISVVHPTQVAIRAAKVSENRTPTVKVARTEGE